MWSWQWPIKAGLEGIHGLNCEYAPHSVELLGSDQIIICADAVVDAIIANVFVEIMCAFSIILATKTFLRREFSPHFGKPPPQYTRRGAPCTDVKPFETFCWSIGILSIYILMVASSDLKALLASHEHCKIIGVFWSDSNCRTVELDPTVSEPHLKSCKPTQLWRNWMLMTITLHSEIATGRKMTLQRLSLSPWRTTPLSSYLIFLWRGDHEQFSSNYASYPVKRLIFDFYDGVLAQVISNLAQGLLGNGSLLEVTGRVASAVEHACGLRYRL